MRCEGTIFCVLFQIYTPSRIMPSLPYTRHDTLSGKASGKSMSNMIGGTANVASESCPTSFSASSSSAAAAVEKSDKADYPNKNQRNRVRIKILDVLFFLVKNCYEIIIN